MSRISQSHALTEQCFAFYIVLTDGGRVSGRSVRIAFAFYFVIVVVVLSYSVSQAKVLAIINKQFTQLELEEIYSTVRSGSLIFVYRFAEQEGKKLGLSDKDSFLQVLSLRLQRNMVKLELRELEDAYNVENLDEYYRSRWPGVSKFYDVVL